MLRVAPPSPCTVPREDPQPLSVDEFRLREMEAREDLECGADERNQETFGRDEALCAGWTFEENLAANERLAHHQTPWKRVPLRMAECLAELLPSQPLPSPLEMASTHAALSFIAGEADIDAEEASVSSDSQSKQHVVKSEVDEEIGVALAASPALRRSDFDGRVRQYLHAIHTKGGRDRVRDAVETINVAVMGKTRATIQKWPAYLVALLKRFHQDVCGGAEHGSKEPRPGRSHRRRESRPGRSQRRRGERHAA